jgi:hypothetical protein
MQNVPVMQNTIVQNNLPIFMEKDDGKDKNIITDIEEFTDRFERVLRAHNLDVDTN